MTPESKAKAGEYKTSFQYQYGYIEPITHTYNKHGCLIIGTHRKIFDYMHENPKEFSYSTFELVMPPVCLGLGILVLFFIIGSSL